MEIMVSKMVMSCFSLDGGDDDQDDDERGGDVNFIHFAKSALFRIQNAQNDRSHGCKISLVAIMQDGAIMQMQNLIRKNNANAEPHWEKK